MKIKTWNILLVIFILLASCKNDNGTIFVKSFEKEYFLESENVGPVGHFASPYLINQVDSLIFVADSKLYKKENFFVYVINIKTNKLVDSICPFGDGPEEFNYVTDIKVDKKKNIWFFDDMKKQLFYYTNSDIGTFKNLKSVYLPVNSFGMYKIGVLNDSTFVGSGNIENARLIYFDNNENIISNKGEYPKGVKVSWAEAQLDYNYATKNIVLAYNIFDIIQIFNQDGDLIKTLRVKSKDNLKTKELSNGKVDYNICYYSVLTTNGYIYALYAGKPLLQGDDSWRQGSYIQVFTIEGEPVCLYKLEDPIVGFTIDEENRIIYGINKFKDQPLTKYKLPQNE
ncbi:MAG: hypothetical protein PWP52_1215 [Bacteroidales bacterium]|nr:hypothetical protein [Bacteroidales bacterium]